MPIARPGRADAAAHGLLLPPPNSRVQLWPAQVPLPLPDQIRKQSRKSQRVSVDIHLLFILLILIILVCVLLLLLCCYSVVDLMSALARILMEMPVFDTDNAEFGGDLLLNLMFTF